MKIMTILGLATAAAMFTSFPCEAARGRIIFGKQETLHRLADVPLKGPGGEDLVLSFKTSARFLGLGLYCKDDGYVLAKASDPDAYFAMIESEKVGQLQTAGLLPQPLPSYKVPAWDYAVGYSLWWVALLGAGFLALKERLTRKKASRASSAPVVR